MSVMLVAAILLPLADEFVVAIQVKLPALVTANRVVAKLSPARAIATLELVCAPPAKVIWLAAKSEP